jgi:hypothetical protein
MYGESHHGEWTERESVWRLRDMKYKITALYHDVNQDECNESETS